MFHALHCEYRLRCLEFEARRERLAQQLASASSKSGAARAGSSAMERRVFDSFVPSGSTTSGRCA